MYGIAKKKYLEIYGETPWKKTKQVKKSKSFPLLESFVEKGVLSPTDLLLAESLEKKSEPIAAFICYLSLATHQGHLCVIVEGETLDPPLEELVDEKDEELYRLILSAKKEFSNALVSSPEKPVTPIIQVGSRYYLQRFWHYEVHFLEKLYHLLSVKPRLLPDRSLVKEKVEQMTSQGTLLKEQAEAIIQGCHQPLTIITGGPGTGKTYTAGHLVRIFLESLSEKEQKNCRFTLAAPTGKAASQLQKSLLASVGEYEVDLQAKTLHSLLHRNKKESFITSDFILVDECSMIDARIMTKLFLSIRPGTKVILLGDKHQLPPVEVGSLFSDMTELLKRKEPSLVVSLKKCLRADLQELVDLFEAINSGNKDAVWKQLEQGNSLHFFAEDREKSLRERQRALLKEIIPHFKAITSSVDSFDELLKSYQKYRVLTPLRRGPFGVERLNQLIADQLEAPGRAIPIMITKNDYELELFNGETGLLVKNGLPSEPCQVGDYALFLHYDQKEGKEVVRRVPALLISHFEKAYVLSVHKSQGSEFDHVMALLPEGAERFSRELFYTAATRAKKNLTVWGEEETLCNTLSKVTRRISGVILNEE